MFTLEVLTADHALWLMNDRSLLLTASSSLETRIYAYYLADFTGLELVELGAEGHA